MIIMPLMVGESQKLREAGRTAIDVVPTYSNWDDWNATGVGKGMNGQVRCGQMRFGTSCHDHGSTPRRKQRRELRFGLRAWGCCRVSGLGGLLCSLAPSLPPGKNSPAILTTSPWLCFPSYVDYFKSLEFFVYKVIPR